MDLISRLIASYSLAVLMALIVIGPAEADRVESAQSVDIDSFIDVPIGFDEGEAMTLKASITSSLHEISVFLLKGREAHEEWIRSEEVDIEAILSGEDVPEGNETFTVIENFSERNITSFDRSMEIGDQDDYFLVIALYRDSSMSVDELSSASTWVEYSVQWNVKEKSINITLLILALILFLIGLSLIIFYFRLRSTKEEDEDLQEEPERKGVPGERVSHSSAGPRRSDRSLISKNADDGMKRGGKRSETDRRRAPPLG